MVKALYLLAHSASTRSDTASHAASHAAAHAAADAKSALGIGIGRSSHGLARRGLLSREFQVFRTMRESRSVRQRNLVQDLETVGQKSVLEFLQRRVGMPSRWSSLLAALRLPRCALRTIGASLLLPFSGVPISSANSLSQ